MWLFSMQPFFIVFFYKKKLLIDIIQRAANMIEMHSILSIPGLYKSRGRHMLLSWALKSRPWEQTSSIWEMLQWKQAIYNKQ